MMVALRPVDPRARAARSQAEHLAWLASLDPDCPHGLTGDPSEADAVLLTDAPAGYALARALLSDPWVKSHWDKVYLYSEEARPFRPLPGVFTSHPRTALDDRVSRAMGYPCWTGALNPWIDQEMEAPPAREPDLLYSFVGRDSHPVRRRLFQSRHPADITHVVDTTKGYRHLDGDAEQGRDAERQYMEVALRSRFVLCPRGWATSTVRLYEMMALGVAPVVLADRWVPPPGPDWERFTIFVAEARVGELPEILEARQDEWAELGAAAFEAFRQFFAPDRQFRTMTGALANLVGASNGGRTRLRRAWPVVLPTMIGRQAFRLAIRRVGRVVSK